MYCTFLKHFQDNIITSNINWSAVECTTGESYLGWISICSRICDILYDSKKKLASICQLSASLKWFLWSPLKTLILQHTRTRRSGYLLYTVYVKNHQVTRQIEGICSRKHVRLFLTIFFNSSCSFTQLSYNILHHCDTGQLIWQWHKSFREWLKY